MKRWRHLVFYNERRPNLYSEDGSGDSTTENEPENLTMVNMNAVSVVGLGDIGFQGIDDLCALTVP